MARTLSPYAEASRTKEFEKLGGYEYDFAKKISRQLPDAKARELLKKFPALLKADGRKARLRGRSFEASRKPEWYDLSLDERVARSMAHEKESCKPTARDRKFAAALPPSLRKEFYEVARGNMESEYSWGSHTVSFNRAIKRMDEILATPGGRYCMELRDNIEYHRRFEMGM